MKMIHCFRGEGTKITLVTYTSYFEEITVCPTQLAGKPILWKYTIILLCFTFPYLRLHLNNMSKCQILSHDLWVLYLRLVNTLFLNKREHQISRKEIQHFNQTLGGSYIFNFVTLRVKPFLCNIHTQMGALFNDYLKFSYLLYVFLIFHPLWLVTFHVLE